MDETLRDAVERAHGELAQDPAAAGELAEGVLATASAAGDRTTAAAAAGVAVVSCLRRGQIERGAELADRAVAEAAEADDPAVLADALVVRMGVHIQRGRPDAALADADRAGPLAPPAVAVRLELQRGLLLAYSFGRVAEAAAVYTELAAAVDAVGDAELTFRFQNNWGLMLLRLGDAAGAQRRFVLARSAAAALGDRWRESAAGWNEALAAARLGDFARVFELHAQLGSAEEATDPRDLIDRADALAQAHLHLESRRAAADAVAAAERTGDATAAVEALVRVADASLELGDVDAAITAAGEARRRAREATPGYEPVARHVLARAHLLGGGARPDLLADLVEVAGDLRAAGWVPAADGAVLAAATVALELGDRERAAMLSAPLAAAVGRRSPAAARLQHAQALALHRLALGDEAGALAAARSGLRVLDRYRASLGATELRTHATAAGERLAELGLRVTLAQAEPRRVLAWAERSRAAALRLESARRPDDPELAADLARLRGVTDDDEQRRLEGRVAERLRRTRQAATPDATPTPAAIVAAMGDRVLVEYVRDGATLAAVVVRDGRARIVRSTAALDAVAVEVDALGFALRRLIRAAVTGRHAEMAAEQLRVSAAVLDELVVHPIASLLDGRSVVVVPTAPLHGVAWSALPALADRPLVVASSAAMWARSEAAHDPGGADGGALLVAGPDLSAARVEVEELARCHAQATVLAGDAATAAALGSSLPSASLLHVAAHGRFRADNPLFSSLLLADGPVTANDLEGMGRLPAHVVLAACEVGQAEVRAGDELLGLASVLFPSGVRTLVASLALAPDDATRVLMGSYHRSVAAGARPASALADARAVARANGPAGEAAAAAFCCFGWG